MSEDKGKTVVEDVAVAHELDYDKLAEAMAKQGELAKKLAKKHAFNPAYEQAAKTAELKSDTAKFFHALATRDISTAHEVSAKSHGGALNYQVRRHALNTSDDSALIPTEFARDIIKTTYDYSVIRRKSNVRTINNPTVELNELTQKIVVTKTGEGANISQSKPTYTNPSIVAEKYTASTNWTYEFEMDVEVDALADIRQQLAERFGAREQESFLNSAVSNQEGIMTASGTGLYYLGGTATSGADTIPEMTAADVINANATNGNAGLELFISKTALAGLYTKITSGVGYQELPLLRFDNQGNVAFIGGVPVNIVDKDFAGTYDFLPQSADTSAGLKFAFLANLRNTFYIGDYNVISVRITQDGTMPDGTNLTGTGGKGLIAIKRTAQKVVQANQITMLSTSTS